MRRSDVLGSVLPWCSWPGRRGLAGNGHLDRSGLSDTKALIDALAPLGKYGVEPLEAALVGFGRFRSRSGLLRP